MIIEVILTIIAMILVGYVLKKAKILKLSEITTLNNLAIYVFLPCLIFASVYKTDISIFPKLVIMPLIGVSISFILATIVFLVATAKKLPKEKKWGIIIPVALGNTAFLGFPFCLGLFGDAGLIRAIFYDIASLTTFLSLSLILMLEFGGNAKDVIKEILSFPVLWALILGILANISNVNLDVMIIDVINYLGAATIPVIMISLGVSLQFGKIKENLLMATLISSVKLFIAPIIAFIIVTSIGLTGLENNVAIIEAAMPAGMLSLPLAVKYKLDFKLTADCVFIATALSLITLPIIAMLL
ncbi:MAG: AEC family transporter [Methanobacteriaceae archaeon]